MYLFTASFAGNRYIEVRIFFIFFKRRYKANLKIL